MLFSQKLFGFFRKCHVCVNVTITQKLTICRNTGERDIFQSKKLCLFIYTNLFQVEPSLLINQVFRRKKSGYKMINNRGRAGVNNSFAEHNSAIIRNILMIPGRIIEQVSAESRIQE